MARPPSAADVADGLAHLIAAARSSNASTSPRLEHEADGDFFFEEDPESLEEHAVPNPGRPAAGDPLEPGVASCGSGALCGPTSAACATSPRHQPLEIGSDSDVQQISATTSAPLFQRGECARHELPTAPCPF